MPILAQVNLQGEYTIAGGDLPSEYELTQLHFHWGDVNNVGSEHQLDGKQYSAEMHIVGYDHLNYNTFEEAGDQSDGLAVVSVLIEVGGSDNPTFTALTESLSNIIYKDQSYELPSVFSILSMLPSDREAFYRYKGSLTTPGCDESVVWTVIKNTIQISEAQINEFRSLKFNAEGEPDSPMVNNYRPPQDLNDRTVSINDMSTGAATILHSTVFVIIFTLASNVAADLFSF
ncbi:carbonic anhydrase 14-like [Glandiceps talaboti]